MNTVELILPLSPSINSYYGARKGGGKYIKPEGVAFREEVDWMVRAKKLKTMLGRLWVVAYIHARNKVVIDIDNRLKSLLDALQHAKVFENDSQIDDLHAKRGVIVPGGRIVVMIGEIDVVKE